MTIETALTLEEAVERLQRAIPDGPIYGRMYLVGKVDSSKFELELTDIDGCNLFSRFWVPHRPAAYGRFINSPQGIIVDMTVMTPRDMFIATLVTLVVIGGFIAWIRECWQCIIFPGFAVYLNALIIYNIDYRKLIAAIQQALESENSPTH